jgi:hypothetical protein
VNVAHELPVFLLPTNVAELGQDSEARAQELLVEALPAAEGSYVEDASRSWWRSELALNLAAGWRIPGLEFLSTVVVLLTPSQASRAADAAEEVILRLKTQPIPSLTHSSGPEVDALHSPDIPAICAQAQPIWRGDVGGDDASTFVGFLLAVSAIARRSAAEGRQLLFYRPEP